MLEFIAQYWIGVLFGGIIVWVQRIYMKRLEKNQEAILKNKHLEYAIQALLRDRILQTYNYHLTKGYFQIYDRENLDELYKQYRALDGNGMVADLIKRLRMLPTEKPNSDED